MAALGWVKLAARGGPHHIALAALRNSYDAWRFNQGRRAYYEYLTALLQGTGGAVTLKQVFATDAKRYGASPRGRLSKRWLELYQIAGGDLFTTWAGVFPDAELALLRNAQERGNDALVETFLELGRALAVLEAGRRILRSSLLAAVFAFAVLLITIAAVPIFTVPRLHEAFSSIPTMYHGAAMRSLVLVAELIKSWWIWLLPALIGGVFLILRSFSRYTGPMRKLLDGFGPWRVYRQVQAMRFLSLLAVALGQGDHGDTRLRRALALQLAGASPWLQHHIRSMLDNINAGRVAAHVLDTGLLEKPQLWFLSDMVSAKGLREGLHLCSAWVESHVLGTVARQAATLRWCLLLMAVAGVFAIALWHYTALDELRRGLALFHASQ